MMQTTLRTTAMHMFYAERTDALNARDPVLAFRPGRRPNPPSVPAGVE